VIIGCWRRHPGHAGHLVRHVAAHAGPALRRQRRIRPIAGTRSLSTGIAVRRGIGSIAAHGGRAATAPVDLRPGPRRSIRRSVVLRARVLVALAIGRAVARARVSSFGCTTRAAGRRCFAFDGGCLAGRFGGGVGICSVVRFARLRARGDQRADHPETYPHPRRHDSPRHAAAVRGRPARSVAATGPDAERYFTDMRAALHARRGKPCHRKRHTRSRSRALHALRCSIERC
jgi:hypothetical protein